MGSWHRRNTGRHGSLWGALASVWLASAAAYGLVGSFSCGPSVLVVGESPLDGAPLGGGAAAGGLSGGAASPGGGAAGGAQAAGADAGGAGGADGGYGVGGDGIPADGASTVCQVLWSLGIWYDDPAFGEPCLLCIRAVSGQDEVSLTPCTIAFNSCYLDSGCDDILMCLSDAEYDPASIEGCLSEGSSADQDLFVDLFQCTVAWCGSPDQCAYSGATPGCEL